MIGSESNGFRKSVVFTKVRLSLVRLFEYGQFCGSAHVCGAGPLGDRSLPRRSLGYIYGGFPLIPPYRCTSEVGRFPRKYPRLRCRTARRSVPTQEVIGLYLWGFSADSTLPVHFRGRAISPKAPCLRCQFAQRSVPT